MKTLIIIRGIPGSGKSTLAARLAVDEKTAICEADNFFIDAAGKYHYIPHLVPSAHEWCRRQVELAMKLEIPTVILSNTSTVTSKLQPYLVLAEMYGYAVQQIVTFGDFGSVHHVPEESIEKMRIQLRGSLKSELDKGLLV